MRHRALGSLLHGNPRAGFVHQGSGLHIPQAHRLIAVKALGIEHGELLRRGSQQRQALLLHMGDLFFQGGILRLGHLVHLMNG